MNETRPNRPSPPRRHPLSLTLAVLLALSVLACGGNDPAPTPSEASPAPAEAIEPETQPAETTGEAVDTASDEAGEGTTDGDPTVIVFLGDSLTAGFGLDTDQAFPALVEKALKEEGKNVRVVNAGVSGDTTAGGLRRLDWLLQQKPDILVVGLGGNDGLRGVDLADSENNLRQIIERGKESGARVLLLGMLIPPNYGQDYTEAFAAIYPRLSKELDVPLVPFLLEGVAGDPELNQADGIHPTTEGQKIVAETVLEGLGAVGS